MFESFSFEWIGFVGGGGGGWGCCVDDGVCVEVVEEGVVGGLVDGVFGVVWDGGVGVDFGGVFWSWGGGEGLLVYCESVMWLLGWWWVVGVGFLLVVGYDVVEVWVFGSLWMWKCFCGLIDESFEIFGVKVEN